MTRELHSEQLDTLGFKQGQSLRWGEGRIGVNNVVGFTNESPKKPLQVMPARFLAGFIPTFLLAEELSIQTGITPTVRIFFPKHIAHVVNGIDSSALTEQTELSQKIIGAFQKLCFPNVSLIFTEDQPITPSAVKVLRNFSDLITGETSKEMAESIHTSAHRHGDNQGEENAHLYIAHHPLGWQEAEAREIFDETIPDIVVNTLPPSEKRFLSLRRSIREGLRHSPNWKTPREIHDIEMNIAGAHYLLLDPTEPTLQDALTLPLGEIQSRMDSLKRRNDNMRKAKNDFERLIAVICAKRGLSKESILHKSLGELLEVTL